MFSIVSLYGTDVPTRPPSVCVGGASVSPNCGAIGVANGDPVVENPPAGVAWTPSLTIEPTWLLSLSAIATTRCTVTLAPGASFATFHVTTPFDSAPPASADTKLVRAGTGSVIETSVASALPMFFSVSVYEIRSDGPTRSPASTFDSTSAGTFTDVSLT